MVSDGREWPNVDGHQENRARQDGPDTDAVDNSVSPNPGLLLIMAIETVPWHDYSISQFCR